jgi:antitoxin MazE
MKVKIAKWGNSLAVRLPKRLADELGLAPGKTVDLQKRGSKLTLESSAPKIPNYRLEDLLAQIKPGDEPPALVDWGPDVGAEILPDEDWSDIAPTDEEMGIVRGDKKRNRS